MKHKTWIYLFWGFGLTGALTAGHLHTAIPTEPFGNIQALVEQATNLNEPDDQGNTPLMVAVAAGRMDVVNLLLDKKVDVTHKNLAGQEATDLCMHRMLEAEGVVEKSDDALILDALHASLGVVRAHAEDPVPTSAGAEEFKAAPGSTTTGSSLAAMAEDSAEKAGQLVAGLDAGERDILRFLMQNRAAIYAKAGLPPPD